MTVRQCGKKPVGLKPLEEVRRNSPRVAIIVPVLFFLFFCGSGSGCLRVPCAASALVLFVFYFTGFDFILFFFFFFSIRAFCAFENRASLFSLAVFAAVVAVAVPSHVYPAPQKRTCLTHFATKKRI
jgi:hypothetical protein